MNKIKLNTRITAISILALLIFSCKSANVVTAEAEEMKAASVISKSMAQKPSFVHLTINAKINAEIDDVSTSLNGKIYINNGKKIWVNVSKFGINGARALITPDGFKAYEKLERTYIDGNFDYFNNLLKIDFIDYGKLQNLLLGRMFVELKASEFNSEIIDNQYVLTYKENDQLSKKPTEGKYIQTYKLGADFYLREAVLKNPKNQMELIIYYENWSKTGDEVFPKNVKIIVKDKKTQKVDLEYNNFTFQQTDTPFEIPSGYKPNDILK